MKTELTRLSIDMDGDLEPAEGGSLVAFSEVRSVITELEQEIEKLRAIKAPVHLSAALREAEAQFRKYAKLHSDKAEEAYLAGKSSDAGGHKLKARVNVELADKMLEALLLERVQEQVVSVAGDDFIAVTHVIYNRLPTEEIKKFLNGFDQTEEFSRSQVIEDMLRRFELLTATGLVINTEVLHVK